MATPLPDREIRAIHSVWSVRSIYPQRKVQEKGSVFGPSKVLSVGVPISRYGIPYADLNKIKSLTRQLWE